MDLTLLKTSECKETLAKPKGKAVISVIGFCCIFGPDSVF